MEHQGQRGAEWAAGPVADDGSLLPFRCVGWVTVRRLQSHSRVAGRRCLCNVVHSHTACVHWICRRRCMPPPSPQRRALPIAASAVVCTCGCNAAAGYTLAPCMPSSSKGPSNVVALTVRVYFLLCHFGGPHRFQSVAPCRGVAMSTQADLERQALALQQMMDSLLSSSSSSSSSAAASTPSIPSKSSSSSETGRSAGAGQGGALSGPAPTSSASVTAPPLPKSPKAGSQPAGVVDPLQSSFRKLELLQQRLIAPPDAPGGLGDRQASGDRRERDVVRAAAAPPPPKPVDVDISFSEIHAALMNFETTGVLSAIFGADVLAPRLGAFRACVLPSCCGTHFGTLADDTSTPSHHPRPNHRI